MEEVGPTDISAQQLAARLSDPEAEREVIGTAVACRDGYDNARRYVVAEDFWLPVFGRIFAALGDAGDVRSEEDRVTFAASAAGRSTAAVQALVDERSSYADVAGVWSQRVLMARRRRDHYTELVAELEELVG